MLAPAGAGRERCAETTGGWKVNEVPSFIGDSNGALHDYEVDYINTYGPIKGLCRHTVRQSKSVKNALASFHRAIPRHGQIRKISKVVAK
jgi:hypothetical protein